MTQITGEGENELSVTYSSQLYGPVVSCEPSAITVHVERYITRRVPVVIEMTGAMPEGSIWIVIKHDPTTLSVSGRSRWSPAWRASWRGWINPI